MRSGEGFSLEEGIPLFFCVPERRLFASAGLQESCDNFAQAKNTISCLCPSLKAWEGNKIESMNSDVMRKMQTSMLANIRLSYAINVKASEQGKDLQQSHCLLLFSKGPPPSPLAVGPLFSTLGPPHLTFSKMLTLSESRFCTRLHTKRYPFRGMLSTSGLPCAS